MAKCAECGSDKIIPNVPLLDVFGDVGGFSSQAKVQVNGDPQAWFFKDAAQGRVSLSVCGECGHAEIRVSNAGELWERHQRAKEKD